MRQTVPAEPDKYFFFYKQADTSVMVSLVGYDVMMVLAFLVGAMNIAPFKYMWWFAGFVFLILIVVQLVQRFEGANDGYKLCNYIFIATACVYPLGVCVS
jgi:bacteriorhodopsin